MTGRTRTEQGASSLFDALAPLVDLAERFVAAENAANAEWDRLVHAGGADPFAALAVYAESDRLSKEWGQSATAQALLKAVRSV